MIIAEDNEAFFLKRNKKIPSTWKQVLASQDCSLHKLAPYIGKLKVSIARELVSTYSKKNDLVIDPFSGSGTVPLEAILQKRKIFASDISPYARVLTRGKLFAPPTKEIALKKAKKLFERAEQLPEVDLRRVPQWVRQFFHPKTLKEAIKFSEVCKKNGNDFFFACFLGILHHQRPGFLSYPSSHLTPYLRDKKFPKEDYPDMYMYRDLKTRMLSKIERSYKLFNARPGRSKAVYVTGSVKHIRLPKSFDCLVTSPPYMNALDYGRDNRLRLWFISQSASSRIDKDVSQNHDGFNLIMTCLAKKINTGLKKNGYCVFVIGERLEGSKKSRPSQMICKIMKTNAPDIKLKKVLIDNIPDIRRSRRDYRGIKKEHFLIFKKDVR